MIVRNLKADKEVYVYINKRFDLHRIIKSKVERSFNYDYVTEIDKVKIFGFDDSFEFSKGKSFWVNRKVAFLKENDAISEFKKTVREAIDYKRMLGASDDVKFLQKIKKEGIVTEDITKR